MAESIVKEDSTDTECRHRWKIASPNGPPSEGVCLDCGANDEFKNSMPVSGWDRDGAKADKKGTDKKGDNKKDNNKSSTSSK